MLSKKSRELFCGAGGGGGGLLEGGGRGGGRPDLDTSTSTSSSSSSSSTMEAAGASSFFFCLRLLLDGWRTEGALQRGRQRGAVEIGERRRRRGGGQRIAVQRSDRGHTLARGFGRLALTVVVQRGTVFFSDTMYPE